MRKEEIENRAQEALKKYKAENPDEKNPGIDVVIMARNEGFHVVEAQFKDETDGIILVDTHAEQLLGKKTNKLIIVSKDRTRAFKRFIIAHELGHYFMNQREMDDGRILVAARDAKHGRSKAEDEFDYFAACILMPKDSFAQIAFGMKEVGMDMNTISEYLADTFVVPVESAERRLKEVGVF